MPFSFIGRSAGGLLDMLGRLGPAALPLGLVAGLLAPPVAAVLRPFLTPFIVAMLVLALVRLDPADLMTRLRQPVRLISLLVWLMIVLPVAAGLALIPVGAVVDALMPDPGIEAVTIGWMLYASAPPLLGAAGIAMMLRADASMTVIAIVLTTIVSPLTVPPIILLASGIDIPIAAGLFMGRLGLIIVGSVGLAMICRRLIGVDRIGRHGDRISGGLVLAMCLFAAGVMDGVRGQIAQDPAAVGLIVSMALLLSCLLQALCLPMVRWLSGPAAAAVMLMAGYRNMGLQIAALGGGADSDVLLFFAAAQVPIYGLPAVLAPLYRRVIRRPARHRKIPTKA
ncbi:hypothetical protein [Fodinicurvata sp. EGI_FJ10296]|uniref:hypothetical protein n=1 Tax=Fodinicurvata sp. EGI_FJ10296 TaxID=3231908 RepID=UPI00345360FD